MKYEYLTAAQRQDILRQKRLQVEAEHAGLTLDLKLARIAGIENEQVAAAIAQLDVLDIQAKAIDDWMNAKEPEPVRAYAENDGSEPAFS